MNARTRPATFAEAAAIEVAAARAAGVYSTNWGSADRHKNQNHSTKGRHRRDGARLRYLGALARGSATFAGLAEQLALATNTVEAVCRKLHREGLIARGIRDGRALLSITPAGRAWLAEQGGEA